MAIRPGKCLLRKYRLAAGLTQDQLSEQLSCKYGLVVSPTTISYYENNRREITSPVVMRAICLVLKNCTEADLYEWPIR